MRRGIPDHLKRWLHMGGRVFFAFDASGATVGYIRAYNRAGARRIAKTAGVKLGPQMLQRSIVSAIEAGSPEVGGREVYRGNPKVFDGSKRQEFPRVPRPTPKKNPPLVVLGNPGRRRGGRMLSERAVSIRYEHATDRKLYEHKFGRGDCIELLEDGSFRVYNKQGKRLWRDF